MNQILNKQICAPISKDLRKKYSRRNMRIMTNDTVKVMRGEYKGLTGKVTKIATETSGVAIEGNKKEKLKGDFEKVVPKEKYTIQMEAMDSNAAPLMITQPEFMRRMKEMQQTGGGGMFGMGNMPEMYNLVVNTNHPLTSEILSAEEETQQRLIKQSLDLARLSQNLLKGEELTAFIKRSFEMVK